jgi:hypothetical protein
VKNAARIGLVCYFPWLDKWGWTRWTPTGWEIDRVFPTVEEARRVRAAKLRAARALDKLAACS